MSEKLEIRIPHPEIKDWQEVIDSTERAIIATQIQMEVQKQILHRARTEMFILESDAGFPASKPAEKKQKEKSAEKISYAL